MLKYHAIGFKSIQILFVILAICASSCKHSATYPWKERLEPFKIENINSKSDELSALRQIITFTTDTSLSAFVEYWPKGEENDLLCSDTIYNCSSHRIVLTKLIPETEYEYRVILNNAKQYSVINGLAFKSGFLPDWLDSYYLAKENTIDVEGKIFIYKRKSPGLLVLLDQKGQIEWYSVMNNFVKTACFTPNGTFLAILSDPGYKTAYGNHVIEINKYGDTLAHFKTSNPGFNRVFHHDVLLDNKSNIVTLTVENIKTDLSSVGGSKNDSVMCDGIQIFTKDGTKLWEWSTIDVENPLNDKNILKDKVDWLHANSLCYDSDSNFLISFYNTNQIWKIDSKTGKLIWKFGENGDFPLAQESQFSGQHTIHINKDGSLMMFDNGIKNKKSRALSFALNEQAKTARMIINAPLPDNLYSEKMGSAYMLDDNTILQCSTNKDVIVATDLEGKIKWQVKPGGLTYRAQFIPDSSFKKSGF